MKRSPKNQRAHALIICFMTVMIIAAMASTYLTASIASTRNTAAKNDNVRAYYAAEAGVEAGLTVAWYNYINPLGGTPGSPTEYRAYLTSLGLVSGQTLQVATNLAYDGAIIDLVTVERLDSPDGASTRLEILATGSFGTRGLKTLRHTVSIEGGLFQGFEFALLGNNINCIMCHAEIDSVERYNNATPSDYGTFDRVKVGSLESMLIRSSKAESHIAGSLYTRGALMDKDGTILSDLSATTLRGYQLAADGTIEQDSFGTMTDVPLTVAGLDATGNPLPNENLYLDYPTDAAQMTDGSLPTEFPPAIPDSNGNKQVDGSEFADIIMKSNGSITGGMIYNVPTGGTYASGSLPGAGNMANLNGSVSGNLILVGTAANPIVLNSDIAVDGDVVIKGVVKGTGQIYARGNLYVVGDVTYADGVDGSGARTFGVAADGTRNALSLTAGGNVMTGDYLTPKKGSITNPADRDTGDGINSASGSFSFAMSEITLFNRMEWTKTQGTLADATGTQVTNPLFEVGYVPRYYTLGPGDPVYIYNKMTVNAKGKIQGTYFDAVSKTWKGKEHVSSYDLTALTEVPLNDPSLAGAAILNLAPENDWLSEENLKNLWIEDENSRTLGDPFKVDALMYTNNSLFTMARKASKTNGQMVVNGAIVAADLGILVPGNGGVGLQLNYDQRIKDFLKIKDSQSVALVRQAWVIIR